MQGGPHREGPYKTGEGSQLNRCSRNYFKPPGHLCLISVPG